MRKRVTIFICNSNMFVPYVMSEILKNADKDYLVLSDITSIGTFYHHMNFPNVDFYKYGASNASLKIKKKELLSVYKQYDVEKIVFFHAECGEMANWFMKQIYKDVPIYYCKIYNSLPFRKVHSIRGLKRKIKYLITWHVNVDILDAGNNVLMPSLPQSFYKNLRVKNLSIDIDYNVIRMKMKNALGGLDFHKKCVLLTGTVVDCGYVKLDEYKNKIEIIIETIGADAIASKCHPRFSSLYGKEKDLQQIPSYIPGNLLINQFEFIIGYESTLLVEAAIAGKKVISLLDYFTPTDAEIQENWHLFFDNRLSGRGEISFPRTIDEIKALIL
ncbi:MAG: hypothetical protein LUC26_02620 [Prevotella sp.]|nr:hypothetical protein [Prevotella sp.]